MEVKQVTRDGKISLRDFDNRDTIYLTGATTISYEIDSKDTSFIEQVDVYYDDILLGQFSGLQGQIYISGDKLTDGTHQLKIDFITTSGSGSLADKYGLEWGQSSKSWIVIVDIGLPPVPTFTTSVVDGFLKITWPKYEKTNFQSYEIYFISHPTKGDQRITYTDPSHNYWIDSVYIGGDRPIQLLISVQNSIGDSNNMFLAYDPQEFKSSFHPEDTSVDLSWRRVKYYGPFSSFVISQNEEKLTTITSPADTTLRLKLDAVFPQQATVIFEMLDKTGIARYATSFSIENPFGAKRTLEAHTWYYNGTLEKVMAFGNGTTKVFDSQLAVEETIQVGIGAMPWPGNYIFYRTGSGVAQRDVLTGEIKTATTYGVNKPVIGPSAFSSAANGLVNYELYDLNFSFDKRYVNGRIDMSTQTILTSRSAEYDPKTTLFFLDKLSDDGRYMFRPNPQSYYSVSGATETYLGSAPVLGHFYSFRPDNTDEVILRGFLNGAVVIMKTTDQTSLRTLPPPESGFTFQHYDPGSKHLLYTIDDMPMTYLVHIETGESKFLKAYGTNCTLVNGYLISSHGYYFKAI